MRTYRLIIQPKLDFGSAVCGSASTQLLKRLNVIPNEAIRISTEVFKTTPMEALHILTNELILKFRREKFLLRTYFKFKCYLNNLSYSCIVNRQLEDFFTRRFNSPAVVRIVDALARFRIPTQPVMLFLHLQYTRGIYAPRV